MAFSSSEGKEFFRDWLVHVAKPLGFKTFLDVGCGAGTYGKIIREVMGRDVQIGAVEIFTEYIERHNLHEIYDKIITGDIRDLPPQSIVVDLIIAGDVLEHLAMLESGEVVNRLRKRCRFLWAALPVNMGRPWSTGYAQPDHEYVENPANKHLHDWTGAEIHMIFKPMWLVPFIQTGCFLIEGDIQ